MKLKHPIRLLLAIAALALLAFVLADVFGLRTSESGVRSPKGYVEISHGSHVHYVPNDWNGSPSISNFPTAPPPEGMTVGPNGQVVPIP